MKLVEDLSGKRFNRLVCGDRAPDNVDKVFVTCDCGTQKYVYAHKVKSGHTKSCGCLNAETRGTNTLTHGLSKSPTFKSWAMMIQRCTNPNSPDYPRYGGRGITVSTEWKSFENFYADMGDRPEGCSLDRIDNNRGYSKDNCRWSTRFVQTRNTRVNRMVDWFGKQVPFIVAHEESGSKRPYEAARQLFSSGVPLCESLW